MTTYLTGWQVSLMLDIVIISEKKLNNNSLTGDKKFPGKEVLNLNKFDPKIDYPLTDDA